MGWATRYIDQLCKGETIQFRPRGNSMIPLIKSGELCTVAPIEEIAVGDIVLCKVNKNQYLHLVTAIAGDRYQISNNKGRINGWTHRDKLYGLLIKVEP